MIDICSYSNVTVYLLDNSHIICENNESGNKYEVTNNIRFVKITSFGGYLYGIDINHKLRSLPK